MPRDGLTDSLTPKGLKSFQSDEPVELPKGDYIDIGEGLYLIKDKHYIYLCEKKANSTEWPKGFKRIATLTPKRIKAIKLLSLRLSGYNF